MKLQFEDEPESENEDYSKIKISKFKKDKKKNREEISELKFSIKTLKRLIFAGLTFFFSFAMLQTLIDFKLSYFQDKIDELSNEIKKLKLNQQNQINNFTNNDNIGNTFGKKSNDKKNKNYFSAETYLLKNKFRKEIEYLQNCMIETQFNSYYKCSSPKLSIIIYSYRNENNIYRLIQSIQNQEFDKRIIILKRDAKKGILDSYIKAILYSRSKYILFLEEDSMILPYLNEIYNEIELYDKDINEFSSIKGTLNGIVFDQKIEDKEKNKTELYNYGFNEDYITNNPILNKIIKAEVLKLSIKSIQQNYIDTKYDLHSNSILYINLFSNSNTYKSFGNYYLNFHMKKEFPKSNHSIIEKMFNSTLILAKYLSELKILSKEEEFNIKCLFISNILNYILSFNIKMNIDINKSQEIISTFINNDKIDSNNKKKMNLILRKIKDRAFSNT